ncbi:MAG: thioredoxin domain-containing protein [Myxococcota bacterium]
MSCQRVASLVFFAIGCAPYRPPADVARAQREALRGVDTRGVEGALILARLHALLDAQVCPCRQPHSLADCLRGHLHACSAARPAARLMVRRLRAGASDVEVQGAVARRYPARDATAELDVAGAPLLGESRAPVVLVAFSDFECPVCREFAPVLERAVKASGGRARLYYKFYPLARHAHAEEAARAAFAAGRQGKFWQMHDALFADPEHLDSEDLERRAVALGLDVEKFRADLDSEAARARVASDRAEGEKAGVNGTPTIFIDGRELDERTAEALREWIEDAGE